MSGEEIKDAIVEGLKKIAPETDPSTLRLDQNIRETLDIDSFDFLNFLIALDEKLGIEIPETDYGKLATLEAMVRYIRARV